MALTATIYNLDVQLSDTDRGVYETLAFKVAQQPSESDEHMVARVLAYCLEYTEGIGFSKGIAEPEEPALFVRDLTGALRDLDRHRLPRRRAPAQGQQGRAARRRLHAQGSGAAPPQPSTASASTAPTQLELYALDRSLIADLVARRERRTKFDLTVTERHLYVSIDGETLEGTVERIAR